jgi:phosphohistidine phosphatase
MLVYLLRHAVAGDRDAQKYPDDDQRPLTPDGIEKMRKAAEGIARIIDPPDVILTSPLVRTSETANIAAAALGCKKRIEACDLLRPGASAAVLRPLLTSRAGGGTESVMLVGHEPDLGRIASELIGASGSAVEFKKGSLCLIRLDEQHIDQPGVLLWHLTPKQLREIGK